MFTLTQKLISFLFDFNPTNLSIFSLSISGERTKNTEAKGHIKNNDISEEINEEQFSSIKRKKCSLFENSDGQLN